MTTCVQCGTILGDGATSCGNCGWRVPEEPAHAAERASESGPDISAPPVAAYAHQPSTAPAKKKSCLGCALGVLALLLVFCIAAGSGFALWYFKGGGEEFVREKYEQAVNPPSTPAGEEAPSPMEAPPSTEPPATEEETSEPEPPSEIPPAPEEPPPSEPQPEPEPPRIIVDRPALRAAKDKADVAVNSFRQALADAERAGATRVAQGEFDALQETLQGVERSFTRADSPAQYEAVARSAKEGVNRAVELQARAERASQPTQGTRKSAPAAPEAPIPTPPPPQVKQPKASFGLIFETPVDGKKFVLKVDGEKLVDQDFRAVGGSFRFVRDFAVPPGKHHLRAAVHQPDGQVAAHEWDFDFQPGTVPVFKVVLEKSPRQMTMKRVQ